MEIIKLKRIIAFILAIVFVFVCSGCVNTENTTNANDDSLQKVLDKGKLVVGLDMDFPPMGYVNENNEVVGFDVDLAYEVCKNLGVELVLQPIEWENKESDLNSGKIDCIWNGLSVTDERSLSMCLSTSYMNNSLIYVIPGDSDIMSTSEISGRTIGVQAGSTAEEKLLLSDIYQNIVVLRFDTAQELLKNLSNGVVDVALTDSVVAFNFIYSSEDTYYILPDYLDEEEYAIGFRKDDQALCERVNFILSDLKAEGKLAEISKKWFGSDITTVK